MHVSVNKLTCHMHLRTNSLILLMSLVTACVMIGSAVLRFLKNMRYICMYMYVFLCVSLVIACVIFLGAPLQKYEKIMYVRFIHISKKHTRCICMYMYVCLSSTRHHDLRHVSDLHACKICKYGLQQHILMCCT